MFQRRNAIQGPLLVASAAIIGGGLVAACARPLDLARGPWLAAFLVLVAGVAQIALHAGQVWLAERSPSPSTVRLEAVAWNSGVAATIVGDLARWPVMTLVGGLGIVVALALFLGAVRHGSGAPRWARLSYLTLVVTVLLSTPVGVLLAWR